MELRKTIKPSRKLTPDTEQGQPIAIGNGHYVVQGFRDEHDAYYERSPKVSDPTDERWYKMV